MTIRHGLQCTSPAMQWTDLELRFIDGLLPIATTEVYRRSSRCHLHWDRLTSHRGPENTRPELRRRLLKPMPPNRTITVSFDSSLRGTGMSGPPVPGPPKHCPAKFNGVR